jgi:D-alanine-D-alanine ligase
MRIAFTHNLLRDPSDERQAEFDTPTTVLGIVAGLEACGHVVVPVDVGAGSVAAIAARIEGIRPDLVFNTAEGTRGRCREALWPALFEAMALPFTGSDAWACTVTLDKQLTKHLVAAAGVPTPASVLIHTLEQTDQLERCRALRFPVIAKPNAEGSSKGITVKSVVDDSAALDVLLRDLLARYPGGILVEEFIVGRDVVVPWLQAASPETGGVLVPCAYVFDAAIIGERKYAIYDYELKGPRSDAVTVQVPAQIDDAVAAELQRLSRRVYEALGLRDLGRIDWRLDERGAPTFIEVNALPSLEPGAGIYAAAALAGLPEVKDVLGAVVDSAAKRYGISTSTAPKALRVGLTYNLKRQKPEEHGNDADAEFDAQSTIDAIAGAIATDGHEVVRLEATSALARTLPDANVDVVFNLAEGHRGRSREAQVPALLDMLGVPHTGSDAATMAVALDKDLAKRVVAGAGVPVPRGILMRGDEDASVLKGFVYPLIAKPNAEGSSKGVSPDCVVDDEPALRALLLRLYARYQQPILVEEFLPGREFTVAVLADPLDGMAPRLLPPMEIVFLGESDRPRVYAFADKQDWNQALRYDRPAVVDDALRARIEAVVVGAWRALSCRDVARFDLRCDADGQPRFIEVNPLPGLSPGWSDLCLIAEASGIDYNALIKQILAPALHRLHWSGTTQRSS